VIHVASDWDLPLELGELGEQATFGEVCQLYRNVTSPETYVTKTSCVLLFIPGPEFQNLMTLCPVTRACEPSCLSDRLRRNSSAV
jgi:hypothetical protein